MSSYDDNYVAGCYGTVSEQLDEAYYDDRSDADDDLEKGRIKFPKDKLYGRERELDLLHKTYNEIVEARSRVSFDSRDDSSRVVFLSGYSGVGKTALVHEFVTQLEREQMKNPKPDDKFAPILSLSGKYMQQSGGAAPFSAVSQVFGNVVATLTKLHQEGKDAGLGLCEKIWQQIQISDIIGPGTDGNEVLNEIFPPIRPLLDGRCFSNTNTKKLARRESLREIGIEKGEPSMNAIKESTSELLHSIASSLQRPLIIFLDDLQWADSPSMELLLFLLENCHLSNVFFICAYRSNEVGEGHSFTNAMAKVTESRGNFVEKMDVFSLSQEAISRFIADSVGTDEVDSVEELVEVIYPKTMGNIFCVKQAIEELVRKNALYYDVMCFEWRWTVDKVELANQVSADVVETIKEKIRSLSDSIQNLLSIMAFIPCSVGVSVLKELLTTNEKDAMSESQIVSLLNEAREEGMLMLSAESGHYTLAHDRIREASRDHLVMTEEDRDKFLLHIADVLQRLGKGSDMEWCLYTAVDLMNSLSTEKLDVIQLIKLNLRVSKIAKRRGSPGKENTLLRESMERLQPIKWRDYDLSLEVFNAVIVSEFALGNHDRSTVAIQEVLDHAKSLVDKSIALLHRVKTVRETEDYGASAKEGIKTLRMLSYNIPQHPTKFDLLKEKSALKLAFTGRSYASLIKLPIAVDPFSELFSEVCQDCLFSGQPRLLLLVSWTAIRRAIKKGVDRYFPPVLVLLGTLLGKQGNVKAANEIGNVALVLSENFKENKADYAFTQFASHAGILFYLQSFRSGLDTLQQCHKELKFSGKFDLAMASMLNYFNAYFASGLSLGSILESKLLVLDEFCQSIDRSGFAATFQIHRQFVMNLRQRSEQPTLLSGSAFQQEVHANQTNKMTVRDASIYRLQLAFIFNDKKTMMEVLETLSTYPFDDQVISRFFIRACFMGLAAFSIDVKNSVGKKCLTYFRRMKKLGSTNAPPPYYFMTALKKPSKNAFLKAIDACIEASMKHLEAMARERYAMFLRAHNEVELAKSYTESAYWLYYDWGAHGKSFLLEQEYPFLKQAKRAKAGSQGNSSRSGTTSKLTSVDRSFVDSKGIVKSDLTYDYNSTLSRRQVMKG